MGLPKPHSLDTLGSHATVCLFLHVSSMRARISSDTHSHMAPYLPLGNSFPPPAAEAVWGFNQVACFQGLEPPFPLLISMTRLSEYLWGHLSGLMLLVPMGLPCLGSLGPKGEASFQGRGKRMGNTLVPPCLRLEEDGIPCLLLMKRLS